MTMTILCRTEAFLICEFYTFEPKGFFFQFRRPSASELTIAMADIDVDATVAAIGDMS